MFVENVLIFQLLMVSSKNWVVDGHSQLFPPPLPYRFHTRFEFWKVEESFAFCPLFSQVLFCLLKELQKGSRISGNKCLSAGRYDLRARFTKFVRYSETRRWRHELSRNTAFPRRPKASSSMHDLYIFRFWPGNIFIPLRTHVKCLLSSHDRPHCCE